MRTVKALLLTAAVVSFCALAQAQSWDNSGNGLLKGNYYVRHVIWAASDADADLADGLSVYGEITFDGNGNYTFNGTLVDGAAEQLYTYTSITGTYTIAASGYGFMDNVFNSYLTSVYGGSNETVFGLVSNGIFIGSSTENLSGFGFNDLAIMAPIASPLATNATFKGSYSFVDLDSPSEEVGDTRDSLFTGTADGNGNFTGVTGSGYVANNGGSATTQSLSAKYSFSNGAGNIAFGGSFTESNLDSTLLAGSHYVYISPDGNFIFGGSPNGWDIFVGVRNQSGAPSNFSGLYYQAGMDLNFTQFSESNADSVIGLESYYGSFNASSGNILEHQRLFQEAYNSGAYDFTFQDAYTFNSNGSSDSVDTAQHYVYGNNGALRIGIGNYVDGYIGVSVGLAAPSFSGPGVYLNPTGIENSASFALFTEQITPGEFLSLAGTGLTSGNNVNPFFPTKLGGVQVLINGVDAPIYYALNEGSYDLLSVLVPYETQPGIANIQVINNNAASNAVSVYVGVTQPGNFTQLSNGIGYVQAQHSADYSLVTTANPAQPGETIIAYMTGLGAVSPAIADGTITPSSTYTQAVNTINVYFDGATSAQGTVLFAGLTPGLIGLYQMNVTVPTGLTAGDNILELVGIGSDSLGTYEDTDNFEALISIGSGGLAVPAAKTAPKPLRPHVMGLSATKFPAGKIQPFRKRLVGANPPRPSYRRPADKIGQQ
jgi:uncharacterized protein (TIGR03437 family)